MIPKRMIAVTQQAPAPEPSGRYVSATDPGTAMNREAAEAGAADLANRAQEQPVTPVEAGDVDTETPGGTSGRRRRNTTAVGSIRI